MNKCLNTVSEQYGKCSNTWWCTYSQRNTEEVSQDPPLRHRWWDRGAGDPQDLEKAEKDNYEGIDERGK